MRAYKCLDEQIFETAVFKIVPVRFEDRLNIMQWRNEQIYHLRQSKPLTLEDQDNYFNNVVEKLFDQQQPNQVLFSFLKEGICVGYGGLVHINWLDKNAEISFIMETKFEKDYFDHFWSVYLSLIEQVAFEKLKLHKIFTYAFDIRPHLYPSLINSGYNKDASLREHCFFDGDFKNVIIHSKIANSTFLRKASVNDTLLTFNWANNKEIRKYSFTKTAIALEEHSKWFQKKIESHTCYYYILCKGNQKIGSIRLDVNTKNEGLISYLIDPIFQGKGYGAIILEKLELIIKELNLNLKKIKGQVLHENQASVKIFRKLAYQEFEEEQNLIFEKELK
ncbi:MAG TPA: GNAT family N-acetyltransferase [Pelobium sp.]|nr:GNAT family N-acetyltransferase [Pelobium sp.]